MSATEEGSEPSHAIQAAERIRALNAINEDIPTLLSAASTAIASLTSKPLPEDTDSSLSPLEARKQTFQKATETYFKLVVSINSRLQAEAAALRDAGIISESTRPGTTGGEEGITNGGLGSFDIGVLNARVGDPGKGWESEVVGKAKQMLEKKLGQASADTEMKD